MRIYKSVSELTGRTPLMELRNIEDENRLCARALAKLEMFNPAGSAKDRVAKAMLDDAEAKGLLASGGTIIEPTSGNTGIGLAAIGASRGYRVIIVMPDSMSIERRLLMTAYGAELVLTEGKKGMAGAIEKARQLARELPGAIIPGQFDNPENARAHEKTVLDLRPTGSGIVSRRADGAAGRDNRANRRHPFAAECVDCSDCHRTCLL